MSDNITLPRKHIDYAAHALEHFNKDAPDQLVSEIIHHLRTALAAEQPKQEAEALADRLDDERMNLIERLADENERLREALAWAYNLRHLRGHSDPVVIPERFAPLIEDALRREDKT